MADPQIAKPDQPKNETRSVYGADFVLLVLLIMVGFGVWALTERAITYLFSGWEPHDQKVMETHGVKKQQAQLADTQTEISQVKTSLYAARIEQLKQDAAVESFKTVYPQLKQTDASADPPTEPLKSFQETKRQALMSKGLVGSLEAQLASLTGRAEELDSKLEKSKEAAERDFRLLRGSYGVGKRLATFVITLLVVILLLSLVRGALWALAKKKRVSTEEGFRPFVWALATLAVLFAYDQFNFAGAAFVAIVFLLLLLQRIEWPRKAGVSTK